MATLLPQGKQYYETSAGIPLVGGKVFTYDAGTSNPRATYQDAAGVTPNTNPVILDARGEAVIFWNGNYKVELRDSLNNLIWTVDNVSSVQVSALDNYAPDTGVVNAYAVAAAVPINAYVPGLRVTVKIATTNTGPSTLNYMGLGAKTITWQNGAGLAGGELLGGGIYEFEYDGVNFQLLDPSAFYPKTAEETAAGVTVVDYRIPSHRDVGYAIVDRYGINTLPGTTDMGPAVQQAINLALSALGAGRAGPPIRFRIGAYSIATALTFGASVDILPIDIGGQGWGTQLINNCAAGTSALFPMVNKSGWYLHDFLMCGNTAHKNDGIQIQNVSTIEFRVERVLSLMAGHGFKLSDVNTGFLKDVYHWPGNNPTLFVAQAVTVTDIGHGIYMTGSFVHNVSVENPVMNAHSGYSSTMRGVKMDCTFSYGVSFTGAPLGQTLSGTFNEISWEIAPTNLAQGMTIQNLYLEGATLRLNNVLNSVIGPVVNGGLGGAVRIEGVSRFNLFIGCSPGIIDQLDAFSLAVGNVFLGCAPNGAVAWNAATNYIVGGYARQGGVDYRCILANTNQVPPNATYWQVCQTFNDANEKVNNSAQPNMILGLISTLGSPAMLGQKWRQNTAWAANMTFNTFGPNHNVVRVNSAPGTAFTVNAPTNPKNGQEVEFTLRNETGGAMGVVTWSGLQVAGWVNPANGFNRTICFYYDSDFGQWKTKWTTQFDCPN